MRVARTEWKLGQEKKDNGVLLLIAIKERRTRIEVGKGLEGALTDVASSRINRNEIKPYFARGDFDNGVKVGVLSIIKAIKGEYKNDEPPKRKGKKNSSLLTILIVLAIIFLVSRRRGGGGGGYWPSGGGWIGPMGGFGSSSGSWGGGDSGGEFGGGGDFGGGGSSDSW